MATEKQIATLRLIAEGKVREHRFGYGAWRIIGAHPTIVGKVISSGWAVRGNFQGDERPITLTPTGSDVLAGSN